MSTAAEIMLRASETQRRMDQTFERWNPTWLAKWMAIGMWHMHLIRAAESTRYQLTYTPGP